MPEYIGTETGGGSEGDLVANGNVYPAVSGPYGGGDIPAGSYTYGSPQPLADDASWKKSEYNSMTDAKNPKEGKEKAKTFRKFAIGTGPKQAVFKDPRTGKVRTGIMFHYDGNVPGTLGCIGYQQPEAQQALIDDPDKTVTVQYDSSIAQARADVETKLGHTVDWNKVEQGRRHLPARAAPGTHSKTKLGNKVKKGNPTVLLGAHNRQTAHLEAPLEDGSKIAEASTSVFVGTERQRVARVDDQTTDGSPLADGEDSIQVG
jgi:hypothetical protein